MLCGLLLQPAAFAQSSATSISFQGALNGANGLPLPNGSYNLTFQFWNHPTAAGATNQAGSASTVTNVVVSGGVASTAVPVDPATFNGQTRYLGIRVNGGAELTPRVMVTAVPYALTITSGQVAGKLAATDKFTAGSDWYEVPGGFNNDFAFAGNRLRGTIANWVQGVNPAWYPLLGVGSRFAGFGIAVGAECESPVIWMYQSGTGRSMFQVRNRNINGDINNGNALMSVIATGKVGIGTEEPQATLHIRGAQGAVPAYDVFRTSKANGDIGFSVDSDGNAYVGHHLWTPVLHIQGGSDLAEPFDVTKPSEDFLVQPGMVMVIDRERDGRLTPCMGAYDTAVAGVLSGANGLKPGMIMQAEGQPHAAGEHPLAMTGRVWCRVDAAHGPIHRGDRLTTSPTPGHAMRVSDDARAPGAVIGKAMTELEAGTGLVLVLVNLQ